MKAERPDQIFVLQQLRQISEQLEAENGRRANLVAWSSTSSTHRQLVIDGRPVQGVSESARILFRVQTLLQCGRQTLNVRFFQHIAVVARNEMNVYATLR